MSVDTANDVIREQRRTRRLQLATGVQNPACALCGITDAITLEAHHAFGRYNDSETYVALCKNDHARETENLRVAGVSMSEPASLLARLAAILGAVAAFLRSLARVLASWAEWVTRFDQILTDEQRELMATLPPPEALT